MKGLIVFFLLFTCFCSPKKEMADFNYPPLTRCTVYEFKESRPVFLKTVDEGNVAFYGIILQDKKNPHVEKYLLSKMKDFMWEYHDGYGVTPADSAFVLEGLLYNPQNIPIIKKSLHTIIQHFFLEEKKAFITVPLLESLPSYWKIPEVTTNSHLGYLISTAFAPHERDKKIEEILTDVAQFVSSNQFPDGTWNPTWFPSRFVSIFFAIRFLLSFEKKYEDSINLSINYLKRTQLENGSWNNRLLDTIFSLRTLNLMSGLEEIKKKAKDWIMQSLERKENIGEHLLYYSPKTKKDEVVFFDCYDIRGEVSLSLANIAIRGE